MASSIGSSARGLGARVHTTCCASATPSASSISCGSFSRSRPTTSVRGPDANSSSSAASSACAPATLCAPSSSSSGCRPTTSSRPGERDAGERLRDDVRRDALAEEALRRGEREHRVVRLVRAVQREEELVVGPGRRQQVERARPPCARRCERTEKSRSRSRISDGLARGEDLDQLGIGLAEHEPGPGLDDARLLARDLVAGSRRGTRRGRRSRSSRPRPAPRRWSSRPRCRRRPPRRPRRRPPPRRTSRTPPRSGSRSSSAGPARTPRPAATRVRAAASSSSSIGTPRSAIRSLTRVRSGLVYEPVERPDGVEQRRDHAGRRGLAVRPGQVHRRELQLR